MKFHRIIRRILLMIGVGLGIITTGATANAKAQQMTADTTHNNNSSNQNINHNQFSSNSSKLVNQLESSPVVNEVNSESTNTAPSSGSDFKSNYNYTNSSSDQVSSLNPRSSLVSSQRLNKSNGRNSTLSSERSFHTKLNHVYHNIISNSGSKIHQNSKSDTNVNLNRSTYVDHYQQIHNWFRDGLNSQNLKARNWVSWHESSHRWRVLSYGGVCVGYFQLNPRYLGYRNGRVDLRPKHQVQVADRYVQKRYGNWVNAKRFWVLHHWY